MSLDNTLIISAYFANLHLSEMGGRSKHLAECKYLPSLKSISKIAVPKLIWYDERYRDEALQLLPPVINNETDSLLAYNLYTSPWYNTIRKLKVTKDINSYGEQRSYDFCINKLKMIQESLVKYSQYDYYWWMDAGLSYEVLYPHKYFPHVNTEGHWERYSECSLMKDCLFSNLNTYAEDKVVVFMINRPEHWIDRDEAPEFYQLGKTIIGGLFGGTRQAMTHMIDELVSLVEECLSKGQLYLEEVYLTLLYTRCPELFKVCEFETWYCADQKHALDEQGNPPKGKGFYHWIEEFAEVEPTPYVEVLS